MKKSLSLLLVMALVFGMFASMASAADLSAKDKYDVLIQKGILKGTTTGDAQLDAKLTRAQFATIAAAMAGLTPATVGETFSDVKKNQWWYGAIEAAAKAGLVNGTGGGKFSPRANVTVESVIKVAVILAGKKPVDGAKVTGSSAWAGPYIQAAIDEGLISARTDYKSDATRGQTIDIAYNAYELLQGPKVTGIKVLDEKNVEVTFSDNKVEKVTLPTALEANKETEITVTHEGKTYKVKVTYVFQALKVESVNAVNLKEVEVKFNKAVDIDTATFTVTPVGGSVIADTPVLSADEKTVSLALASNLAQNSYVTVDFSGVKAADGTPFAPFSVTVKVNDTVAPSVAEIKSLTKDAETNAFEVTFSEFAYLDTVKVGDVIVAPFSLDNKTYTFTLPSSATKFEAGKTYEAVINGLRDLAGNYATQPLKASFTVVRDQIKPVYTLVPVNPTQFDIVFNEEMQNTVPVDAVVVKNAVTDATLFQSGLPVRQSDKKSFRVTLMGAPIAPDKTSVELKVSVKGFNDVAGNTVEAKTSNVTLLKESVKPEMTTVRLMPSTNNRLEVTFSEPVSGIATTDFALTDSDNTVIAITSVENSAGTAVSATDASNRVYLDTAALTYNGTFKLANIVDSVTDTSGNKNIAKVISFTYNDVVAPQVTAAIVADKNVDGTLDLTSATQAVAVKFNQTDVVNGISVATGNFKDGAANNPANYTLNGAALPSGTVVKFIDSFDADMDGTVSGGETTDRGYDLVQIDFSAVAADAKATALKEGGKIVVTASNIKTVAGSTIPFASAELNVVDVTAPTIAGAYLTGDASDASLKLTVQFSEEVTYAAFDNTKLVLAGKQADGTTSATNLLLTAPAYDGADKTKVVFTIASTDLDVTKPVTLTATSVSNIKDVATTPNDLGAAGPISVVIYATN
ncbi:hypothetical protein SD71_06625 [Cohnella kolymensis]|uniref:SLH domain-containing protein n=2 Tax=Cohnella kolymensis TaxID=1590652 RepID=A0ABR5A6M3_9BACL|nr:hypothetical protein SD71_06625 [Cohnella kolymensis]